MTDENNRTDNTKLAIPPKIPKPGSWLKRGIAAQRAQADEAIKIIDPTRTPNRIGLVIDDSGSMGEDGMKSVHAGVRSFTNSCDFNTTSLAIYPLNRENKPLSVDFDPINLYVGTLQHTGGTQLYTKLDQLVDNENITRAVVFSDGVPTDCRLMSDNFSYENKPRAFGEGVLAKYIEKELPIDTIYIGEDVPYEGKHSAGYTELEEIAKRTGGVFCHFKSVLSLGTSLKYLAPKYRALLMNEELKKKVEKGESL